MKWSHNIVTKMIEFNKLLKAKICDVSLVNNNQIVWKCGVVQSRQWKGGPVEIEAPPI